MKPNKAQIWNKFTNQQQKYSKESLEEKLVDMLISPEKNLPQLSNLRSLFLMMDQNQQGYIDLHKLEQIMTVHGANFSKKQMESFKKFAKITEE